jgi:hypothetical protein
VGLSWLVQVTPAATGPTVNDVIALAPKNFAWSMAARATEEGHMACVSGASSGHWSV